MRQGERLYYFHGDHLGSTSLTTDRAGRLVAETRYQPYGQERWSSGATPTDFGFTGQRHEASFGLLDYNARYYSPVLGRFISPDSIVPELRSSQAWNRYVYVDNNPVKYVDPTGHCKGLSGRAFETCKEAVISVANAVHSTNDWVDANRETLVAVQAGGVDVLPIAGDAKGLAEVFTGYDLMTGEDLGHWRWAGLVFLSEFRLARHGDDVVDAWKLTGRHLDKAGDFAGDYFGKYDVGQGFTGAFDASTGNLALRPSTTGRLPGPEWAPRTGGHAYVGRDLFDDIESSFSYFGTGDPNWNTTYGFAISYVKPGQLEIASWSSGVLNEGKPSSVGRIPSKEVRSQMVDSLKESTGWDVIDPFD